MIQNLLKKTSYALLSAMLALSCTVSTIKADTETEAPAAITKKAKKKAHGAGKSRSMDEKNSHINKNLKKEVHSNKKAAHRKSVKHSSTKHQDEHATAEKPASKKAQSRHHKSMKTHAED